MKSTLWPGSGSPHLLVLRWSIFNLYLCNHVSLQLSRMPSDAVHKRTICLGVCISHVESIPDDWGSQKICQGFVWARVVFRPPPFTEQMVFLGQTTRRVLPPSSLPPVSVLSCLLPRPCEEEAKGWALLGSPPRAWPHRDGTPRCLPDRSKAEMDLKELSEAVQQQAAPAPLVSPKRQIRSRFQLNLDRTIESCKAQLGASPGGFALGVISL